MKQKAIFLTLALTFTFALSACKDNQAKKPEVSPTVQETNQTSLKSDFSKRVSENNAGESAVCRVTSLEETQNCAVGDVVIFTPKKLSSKANLEFAGLACRMDLPVIENRAGVTCTLRSNTYFYFADKIRGNVKYAKDIYNVNLNNAIENSNEWTSWNNNWKVRVKNDGSHSEVIEAGDKVIVSIFHIDQFGNEIRTQFEPDLTLEAQAPLIGMHKGMTFEAFLFDEESPNLSEHYYATVFTIIKPKNENSIKDVKSNNTSEKKLITNEKKM